MARAKLSSKGQLIIPHTLRKELNLKPGDEFSVFVDEEYLIFKRTHKEPVGWEKWQGFLKRSSLVQELTGKNSKENGNHG